MKKQIAFLLLPMLFAVGCQSGGFNSFTSWRKNKAGDKVATSLKPSHSSTLAPTLATGSNTTTSQQVATHLSDGHQAMMQQRIDDARHHYTNAVSVQPDNAVAHHRLGVIADLKEEYNKAARHYLHAVKLQPNNPELLSDIGYSFLLQERYTDSEKYLVQALQLEPSHKRSLNNLGLLYAKQGDTRRALATFRRANTEKDAQQMLASATGQPVSPQAYPHPFSNKNGGIQFAGLKTPPDDGQNPSAIQPVLQSQPDNTTNGPNNLTRQLKQRMEAARRQSISERRLRDVRDQIPPGTQLAPTYNPWNVDAQAGQKPWSQGTPVRNQPQYQPATQAAHQLTAPDPHANNQAGYNRPAPSGPNGPTSQTLPQWNPQSTMSEDTQPERRNPVTTPPPQQAVGYPQWPGANTTPSSQSVAAGNDLPVINPSRREMDPRNSTHSPQNQQQVWPAQDTGVETWPHQPQHLNEHPPGNSGVERWPHAIQQTSHTSPPQTASDTGTLNNRPNSGGRMDASERAAAIFGMGAGPGVMLPLMEEQNKSRQQPTTHAHQTRYFPGARNHHAVQEPRRLPGMSVDQQTLAHPSQVTGTAQPQNRSAVENSGTSAWSQSNIPKSQLAQSNHQQRWADGTTFRPGLNSGQSTSQSRNALSAYDQQLQQHQVQYGSTQQMLAQQRQMPQGGGTQRIPFPTSAQPQMYDPHQIHFRQRGQQTP